METKRLMIDTSILIEYFRKTNKDNSKLFSHLRNYNELCISTITVFELYNGAPIEQKQYWDKVLESFTILSFDRYAAIEAANIVEKLKKKRKSIDKADLFIAAIAIVNNLSLDTLNTKHFIHIENLNLLKD